jgi:hypothetical protein
MLGAGRCDLPSRRDASRHAGYAAHCAPANFLRRSAASGEQIASLAICRCAQSPPRELNDSMAGRQRPCFRCSGFQIRYAHDPNGIALIDDVLFRSFVARPDVILLAGKALSILHNR